MAGGTSPEDGDHPVVQQVVRGLLAIPPDHADPREAAIVAAETAYGQLRARLVMSLGELGFDALWARAIRLAMTPTAVAAMRQGRPLDPALRTLVHDRDTDATTRVLHGVFTRFFEVFVTFIGEPLMVGIITQLWPALTERISDPMQRKELDHDAI